MGDRGCFFKVVSEGGVFEFWFLMLLTINITYLIMFDLFGNHANGSLNVINDKTFIVWLLVWHRLFLL